MDELARRVDRAAESILENESLTANLDDASAKALLDWGVACAEMIAQSSAGLDDSEAEGAMSPRLRATRRLMRSVNEWLANRQRVDAKDNAMRLDKIIEQASIIYGESFPLPDSGRRDAFLARFKFNDPLQMIADLRQFLGDTYLFTSR